MGTRGIERRLRKGAQRLSRLRAELGEVDAQLAHLADEAADAELRAVVAESPEAAPEGRRARAQADAMAAHRAVVVARIAELEAEQDRLLDAFSAAGE
jgi:hypothetical protein